MLALSPPLFSTVGWPLEDPISHDYNYFYKDNITTTTINDQTAQSSLHILPSHQLQAELDRSTPSTTISGEYSRVSPMATKLNHNASERDRRKKINNLYASLRSLLPADQTKMFSIPNTISHALKYIPELQKQVEGLNGKREELLSRASKQEGVMHAVKKVKITARSSLSAGSTYRLNDTEVAIQISTFKSDNNLLSEILLHLEEEGLQVQDASSFESFGGRIFYNLHLQVERTYRLDCENLNEKLMSFYG
ncbi:transcription factor ORG2-like [Pyrus ussuriensis x Pyrus communis]|uniref:Transcription factor ORG2-like n=1 Tax=Pyrus ussuriensis x Pyrus communis TaxID=2448454 RepID=A0A5N5HU15_9ROSA|nr:transcription factor ORG2-like [Pyrus ussuriensis x Pyrus communis]